MALFSNIQINVDTLPKSEDLKLIPVSPKYFYILLLNISSPFIVLTTALLVLNFFTDDSNIQSVLWYAIAILFVFFIISAALGYLGFKKRKYAIREKDMTYSHGYIVHNIITLPYNRIQHIEIARSFLSRKLGLSTLKIYSAGQSGGDIAIKGLPRDIADAQYAFLTKIINERV